MKNKFFLFDFFYIEKNFESKKKWKKFYHEDWFAFISEFK